MNLAKASLKIFFARLGGSVIAFLGTVYFARELGTTQFGIFALFQALAQMLAVPADFGLQGAVVKRMSEQDNPSKVLSTAIIILGGTLALVCSVILLFQDLINAYIGAKLAVFLVIVVVLNELSKLATNTLRGELRVGETASLNFAQQLVYNSLGAILLFAGADVFGLVYAFIVGFIIVVILGSYKCNTTLTLPSIETAYSLFDFAKFSVISYIDSYLYNWLDVAIIGLLLTQSEVGAYEVAWRVSMIVMLLSGAIQTTILPQISAWSAEGAHEQIENVLPDAIIASLFFIIPAFFGVLILSREILYYVFTPEYATAWLVLVILVGGKLFESIDMVLRNTLSGMDRPDLRAVAVVVSIVLNIILNFILVWLFNSIGAAIATVTSFAVSTFISGYYLSQMITIELPYQEIVACVISSILMTIALLLVRKYVPIQSLPSVLTSVLFGGIIYFSIIFIFPSMRMKMRMALRTIVA